MQFAVLAQTSRRQCSNPLALWRVSSDMEKVLGALGLSVSLFCFYVLFCSWELSSGRVSVKTRTLHTHTNQDAGCVSSVIRRNNSLIKEPSWVVLVESPCSSTLSRYTWVIRPCITRVNQGVFVRSKTLEPVATPSTKKTSKQNNDASFTSFVMCQTNKHIYTHTLHLHQHHRQPGRRTPSDQRNKGISGDAFRDSSEAQNTRCTPNWWASDDQSIRGTKQLTWGDTKGDITKTTPRHHRDNTKTTPRHHQKKTETRPRHDREHEFFNLEAFSVDIRVAATLVCPKVHNIQIQIGIWDFAWKPDQNVHHCSSPNNQNTITPLHRNAVRKNILGIESNWWHRINVAIEGLRSARQAIHGLAEAN